MLSLRPIACVWLVCALLGCSGDRLLGRDCPGADCSGGALVLPPPTGCGAQYTIASAPVPAGFEEDRCALFTIDALEAQGEHGHVYLTAAHAVMQPLSHDLDVRLAPSVDDLPDGPVECGRLWSRAVPWIPLMTAQDGGDVWDFSAAPLVAAPSYRLLINQHVLNTTERAVVVGVKLNLECAAERPPVVSHAFEFIDREAHRVGPGESRLVTGNCTFDTDVDVARLYRRTHLIDGFAVRRLSDNELLWDSGPSTWTRELDPPLHFAAGDGFYWQCLYTNMRDVAFEIGGNSSDACSLLGLYRLPDGSEDPTPQHCQR